VAISPFKLFIFLILLLRISLFSLPSFDVDMGAWKAWGERLAELGPANFYSETFFTDYFPGYLYILWLLSEIYQFISFNASFDTFLFETLIKISTTAFDLGTAYFIYKIVLRYKKSLALFSTVLYLSNPALIFNSSVWGQVDGVLTFFLVMGIYFLVEKKKLILSNLFLAFSILIKPQAIAVLPTLFNDYRRILFLPLLMFIFSLPFFPGNVLGLYNMTQRLADLYPYTSLYAYNFWSLIGWWQNDSILFLTLSYKTWGIMLYSLALFLILIPFLFKKVEGFTFYLSSSLSFFAFFLFLTRMHERYLFPFFALLLIAALIKKSKTLLGIYVLTSLIHFGNLWYVYYFYNFVFKGVEENSIYNILNDNYKILSLSLFLVFFYLLIFYYRSLFPTLKPKVRIK
jgi:dolichyl-phosphate-mannose-protein mannosyltransferase